MPAVGCRTPVRDAYGTGRLSIACPGSKLAQLRDVSIRKDVLHHVRLHVQLCFRQLAV
jgi:hypothetical protein